MNTPCKPWAGRINDQGYGTIGSELAHRRVWTDAGRALDADETLDHLCHDPNTCRLGRHCPHRRCVNLDHLEPVSHAENKRRGGSRGARITVCPDGHEYTADNTVVYDNKRYCLTCRRRDERARRAAAKAARCVVAGHSPTADVRTSASGKTYCGICFANARRGPNRRTTEAVGCRT